MNFHQRSHTLTDCDREPIHQIGAVQDFGGLIVCTADWVIAQQSTNCAEVLGCDTPPAIGTPLAALFQPRAISALAEALARISGPDMVERVFGLRLTQGGAAFDCALHLSDGRIVIEFEPHAASDYDTHLALVGPLLAQLSGAPDTASLCSRAVTLVRELLGYDRTMIYRFHRDLSGEVVAEDHAEGMEPFLGLRYPASDIPQQARELFRRNRFRVIADVDGALAAITPQRALDGQPLDLSLSTLRASSPIHLDYLRNMGVTASLTIAITVQGKLWGLITCHHRTRRLPAYSLRTVADLFSQTFSLMLDRLQMDHSQQLRARGRELHESLLVRLAEGTSLSESTDLLEAMLRDLIPHDGLSVLMDGHYRKTGSAPDEAQFLAITPMLGTGSVSTVLASAALAEQILEAQAFADHAAGALVLPISRSPRDYMVLWRRPLAQTVTWAGNPAKAVEPGADRLMPRSSFAAWAQTIEGRAEDWADDEIVIAEGVRVTLLEVVLRMTDEVARERKRAAELQDLMIAELNHRVRNILGLIKSLVGQSRGEALSVESFATIVGGRIAALANAHDNITREQWSAASLRSLFETELAAYLGHKRGRFDFVGEDVLIKPEAYTVLALVVHELVTNSAKYGSLCDSTGSVCVEVSRTRHGDVQIGWRERGGPPVKPPLRRGFGSTIIERSIPYELRGEAELRFKLAGLEADFLVPARFVDKNAAPAPRPAATGERADLPAAAPANPPAVPEHVLLVEDSMIIALDTEDSLKQLGVQSVTVEGSVSGALRAIAARQPDFAIVDFNLGSESSESIATELRARGVRFVFATGYAEIGRQLDTFGAEALLRKPYGRDDIAAVLVPAAL